MEESPHGKGEVAPPPPGATSRRVARYAKASDANMSAELGLIGLCILSGVVGFHYQDVVLMCTIFVGGLGTWLALSIPRMLTHLKEQTAADIKTKEEEADRAKTKAANGDVPAMPSPGKMMHLIKARRSIYPKDFTGAKVPRHQIEQLLEAAVWAPTHNLTQPWKFVVLDGEGKKTFEDLTLTCVERYTPPDKAAAQVEKLKGKAAKTWPKVSHYIVICMTRTPTKSGKLNPEWEDIASVACAVQNIHLLAHSMGLAGYWSSWQAVARDAPEMADFLGLNTAAGDKCLGVFSVGLSDRGEGYRGTRAPVQEKVTWLT